MTQIITMSTMSMISEDKYTIPREGVAWSASNYVARDISFIQPILSGEVFTAAEEYNPELIKERYDYSYKHGQSYKFSHFELMPSQKVWDAMPLFFDPRYRTVHIYM